MNNISDSTPLDDDEKIVSADDQLGKCPFYLDGNDTTSIIPSKSSSSKKNASAKWKKIKKVVTTARVWAKSKGSKILRFTEPSREWAGGLERLNMIVSAAESASITLKDIAIIKEGWNKLLAFRSNHFFEALTERWFYLNPQVEKILSLETEDMPNFLYSWIDLCVHNLQPETEVIHRESFQPAHTSPQRFSKSERYAIHLVVLGVDADAMQALDEAWFFALKTHTPYFESSDMEELKDREGASLVRIFRQNILHAFLDASKTMKQLSASCDKVGRVWKAKTAGLSAKVGRQFFRLLFEHQRDLLDYFCDSDLEEDALLLVDAVEFMFDCIADDNLVELRPKLAQMAANARQLMLPSWSYAVMLKVLLDVCKEVCGADWTAEFNKTTAFVTEVLSTIIAFPHYLVEKMVTEADSFFDQAADQFGWSAEVLNQRKLACLREVYATGTHNLTAEELSFGAQLAWRNTGKCSGRVSWNTLTVRDCRHIEDPMAVFEECVDHQRLATSGTNVTAAMSVFRPRRCGERWGPRIWNPLFVSFAGWVQVDGTVIGDAHNTVLTAEIVKLFPNWEPQQKTATDILPVIIEVPGHNPMMFEIPSDAALCVEIEHPENPAVKDLGLKWSAVQTNNLNMRLAGIDFPCAPFNGWFLDIVVARFLMERYDATTLLAEVFPDIKAAKDLGDDSWLDMAFLQLIRAVYHSYTKQHISCVSRATISRQMSVHQDRERTAGREVPAQWSWIGGLLGPCYGPWKHECRDFLRFPQYQYHSDKFVVTPYMVAGDIPEGESGGSSLENDVERANAIAIVAKGIPTVTILFGSETGTAETYARKVADEFKLLSPTIACLNDAATADGRQLLLADIVLIVTSTFGSGSSPFNAMQFLHPASPPLPNMACNKKNQTPVKLAVCGIGSTVYPDFAAYGRKVWGELRKCGADALIDLVVADEMSGQVNTFNSWLDAVKLAVLPPALLRALQLVSPPEKHLILQTKPTDPKIISSMLRFANDDSGNKVIKFVPRERGQFKLCEVKVNRELRKESSVEEGRSTRRFEFDVSVFGEHSYTTGDHAAIVPVLKYDDVFIICQKLRVIPTDSIVLLDTLPFFEKDPNEESLVAADASDASTPADKMIVEEYGLKYEVLGQSTSLPYNGLTWLELFSNVLESTLQSSFVGELIQLMVDSYHLPPRGGEVAPEREAAEVFTALARLSKATNVASTPKFMLTRRGSVRSSLLMDGEAKVEDDESLASKIPKTSTEFTDEYINLANLFAAFPGIAARIDLVKLLTVLPKLKARYYSISSSHIVSPNIVALSVGLVLEETPRGTMRKGFCSSYLNQCEVGEVVLASIRHSNFRLPESPLTPIVCVGPGTGLAPFAAFLDHRMHQLKEGQAVGHTICFTSAKVSADLIYLNEIQVWEQAGPDTIQVRTVLSREGKRMRVQQLMKEHGEEIVSALMDRNGYYYCCGDSRMAEDTIAVMIELVAKVKGISRLAAKDKLNEMRAEGRYQLDVWGLVSFFSQGLAHFANKKADQAKQWLEMIQESSD